MLVTDFNPDILVNVIPSILAHKFKISIRNLPPKESIEYWIFEPDGDNIGTGQVTSDEHGQHVDKQGNNFIYYGSYGSRPIKKGKYHFGINRIKHDYKSRMSLSDWKNLPGEKMLAEFDVNYESQSFLTIQADRKVPWGMKLKVSGQLWLKDEPFTSCSGATDYIGRIITFTGNGIDPTSTVTDGFSKFSAEIRTTNQPGLKYSIQAHYEGDEIMFQKCDSENLSYELVKHNTSVTLGIQPLIPQLGDILENNRDEVSLKVGKYYLVKGHLHDIDTDGLIPEKMIRFAGSAGLPLPLAVTDQNGNYSLSFNVPNSCGINNIEAIFRSDDHYNGSTEKVVLDIINKLDSQILPFSQFKAFGYFGSGFQESTESPQVISTVWLLSILGANPMPLGLFKKDGEEIVKGETRMNHSGDVLANLDGIPLVIDCTITVPDTQKIDKISNIAKYLSDLTGKKFIPVIISNKPANVTKQLALTNGVLLIDVDDTEQLVKLVSSNKLEDAKLSISNMIKKVI